MKYSVIRDTEVKIFQREAEPLLYKNEAGNGLILGICCSLLQSSSQPVRLFRVLDGDSKTVSCAIQTPPYNLILTQSNFDQLTALSNFIFDSGFELPGVVGPAIDTNTFSELWSKMTGCRLKIAMNQKIYYADSVITPDVDGALLKAFKKDVDSVSQWLWAFSEESLPVREKLSRADAESMAIKAINDGTAFIWCKDGEPVSVAHVGRPTTNGISIRAVFTPKVLRGRGYGSAVTAALTARMLEEGKRLCFLYTDMNNHTANKIYKGIGYKEVMDSIHVDFFC